MIFPIGDDNIVGGYKPFVSYTLLVLNLIAFIYTISLGTQNGEIFLNQYGSIPFEISQGDDLYTLLSSMFLHGGWMHLLGNMLFLWIFADNIEAVIGSSMFLLFYLCGGLFASFAHILTDFQSVIPMVGASGAISAVMGTYLVMFPKSRIKIIILIFFSTFYLPAILFLGIWFAQQLFSGIGNFGALTGQEGGGVAWWAHIGGFIYGILIGYFFKQRYGHKYSYGIVDQA